MSNKFNICLCKTIISLNLKNVRKNTNIYFFEKIFGCLACIYRKTKIQNQTSRHAYRYLQQAAEHGNTEAVSMYACLIAFGEIPGRGKWDVEPNPQETLRICDYYTKEALNDEKVKQTIQILKKAAGNRGGNQSSSEGCYIATAVYGDYDVPEVLILRSFRDGVLLKSFWGKIFVKIYYFFSPPLANYLKNYDRHNNKVKSILDKFVDFIKHNS